MRTPSIRRLPFSPVAGHHGGQVRLEAPLDFTVILDAPAKVRPDREFRRAVEQICGGDSVEVLAT